MLRQASVLAPLISLTLMALTACDPRVPPMPETWAEPKLAAYKPSTSLPAASAEGASPDGSLLQEYAERTPRSDQEVAQFVLPFQAKTMVVELLIAAGKDDPERMRVLLADNARFGLPDRRELRARPIFSDKDPHGAEFIAGLRNAASRFSAKATFTCTPLQPGWQMFAASGAEPVWCSYTSADNFDLIGMRLITIGGRVKADYIGFFPNREFGATRVVNAGDPPPLTPYMKFPVDLTLPELMPDGSNPVIEKPSKAAPASRSEPADAPIPVPAR